MKIYNKRKFASAAVMAVLSAACLAAYFFSGLEGRFLAAFFVALVCAGVQGHGAFSKKAFLEGWEPAADERDVFIAMETGRAAVRVLNLLLLTACLVSTVVYALLPSPACLAVLMTLCAVSIVLFAVTLCANLYYEKKR